MGRQGGCLAEPDGEIPSLLLIRDAIVPRLKTEVTNLHVANRRRQDM